MFKVPAQLYLVIFYKISLLLFQLVPVQVFFQQSFLHSHVVIKTFKTLLCFFQALIASKRGITRCNVHYSFYTLVQIDVHASVPLARSGLYYLFLHINNCTCFHQTYVAPQSFVLLLVRGSYTVHSAYASVYIAVFG